MEKTKENKVNKKIKLEPFEGYAYEEGGVCAAKGFVAGGLNCGLNSDPEKNDLCLIYTEKAANGAAVYTRNQVKAAPILVTKRHMEATGGKVRAVIANSKNANACNPDGEEKAEAMCSLAAEALNKKGNHEAERPMKTEEVLVASTGVIGQVLPIEPIENHIEKLTASLSREGHAQAANAIMTTDTVPKEVAVSFTLQGKTCHLGGMAKGSGMIHPNMATTLNFITTDAAVSSAMLQEALDEVVQITYNCLSVDGDTSTNDMVLVLANAEAGNKEITSRDEDFEVFRQALYIVMLHMTKMLAKDGEGATKLLECRVSGAPDKETGIIVAKSVIRSPLVKCAMFGEDANCGRILCAVGYAEAEVDIHRVDVEFASEKGRISVCKDGNGLAFSEEKASLVLNSDEIQILIDLKQGQETACAWGCDLTYDYVKINGDYRS